MPLFVDWGANTPTGRAFILLSFLASLTRLAVSERPESTRLCAPLPHQPAKWDVADIGEDGRNIPDKDGTQGPMPMPTPVTHGGMKTAARQRAPATMAEIAVTNQKMAGEHGLASVARSGSSRLTNYQGWLEWRGCSHLHDTKITGVRTMCFEVNTFADHCVAIVDIEQPYTMVDDEIDSSQLTKLEWWTALKQNMKDIDFKLLMKKEGEDKVYANEWVPIELRGWYSSSRIQVAVFAKDVSLHKINPTHYKFKRYVPRSLLLELYGGMVCDVQDKESYHRAVVDCKPVHLNIEDNPNYGAVLSAVWKNAEKNAFLKKPLQASGANLEPHFEWRDKDTLQNKIPATVDGLKFWITRYLISFPWYVGIDENCQKFSAGVYLAAAAAIEDTKEHDYRHQAKALKFANMLSNIASIGSFGWSSKSSSDTTDGTIVLSQSESCDCDAAEARVVVGQNDKNEEAQVCVSDRCTDGTKCMASTGATCKGKCKFFDLLTVS